MLSSRLGLGSDRLGIGPVRTSTRYQSIMSRSFFPASKMASGEETGKRPPWLIRKIEGVLIDITGVLYNSSEEGGEVIPGSVQAIER